MADSPQTTATDSSGEAQHQAADTVTALALSVDTRSNTSGPESEAHDEPSVADEYRQYMNGERLPEYGVDGLVTLRYPSYAPSSDSTLEYDIVVVHGLKGARRPPWNNPGSGDSSWIDAQDSLGRCHLMSFGYHISRLLSGRSTRASIRDAALRLLRELWEERSNGDKDRPIMFVCHDIGGVVVKEALVIAGLDSKSFGDVFDFTRVLLLYGCPHSAGGPLDMEDKLVRFIYKPEATVKLPPAAGTVPYLTEAVQEVNDGYLESKHYYQCYVISIHSGSETDAVHTVFDSPTATMGLPFEITINNTLGKGEEPGRVETKMIQMNYRPASVDVSIAALRAFLSTGSPLVPLRALPIQMRSFAWIDEDVEYKAWLAQGQAKLLYLYGSADITAASEHVFHSLKVRYHGNLNQLVLTFTFDRHDARRRCIRNMLASFIAQIVGHFPRHYPATVEELLKLQRTWSARDLLVWFDYFRLNGNIGAVSCILDGFDECDPVSSKEFLDFFTYKSKIQESPWRVLLTSREAGTLLDQVTEAKWPAIDLAQRGTPAEGEAGPVATSIMKDMSFFKEHPELRPSKTLFEEITGIVDVEPGLRRTIIEYMLRNRIWEEGRTITDIFGPTEARSVVQTILGRVSCLELAIYVLSWILYSARPLTVREMCDAIAAGVQLGLLNDETTKRNASGSLESALKGLAGIVSQERNELRIANRELRDLFTTRDLDTTTVMGSICHKITNKPHELICKACIQNLSTDSAKERLVVLYNVSQQRGTHMAISRDRTSLLNYAVEFGLYHLSQASKEPTFDPKATLTPLVDSGSAKPYLDACWLLANPFTRTPQPHTNLSHILIGAGVGFENNTISEMNDDEKSAAMIEAFFQGRSDLSATLLAGSTHSTETLEQGLVAAGAYGNESNWLSIIDHIKTHYPEFPWQNQGQLVARASILGLTSILQALVDCGCPLGSAPPSTLLRMAIRYDMADSVAFLLENKVDPNHADYGEPALHMAATYAQPKIVELLVGAGADINIKDENSTTPVYSACLWGNYEAERNLGCARVLLEGGADPTVVGPRGTALIYAVESRSVEICKLLIEKGADVNDPKNTAWSPLGLALLEKECEHRLDMVKLLLKHKANVNSTEPNGGSPLILACFINDPDQLAIVDLLLEHGRTSITKTRTVEGIDVNCPNRNLWTPLKMAITNAGIEVVTMLLDNKADPNLHHESEEPPIMVAVRNDLLDFADLLVQRGVNLDTAGQALDDSIWYPLEWAVCEGRTAMIRFLCDHGADPNCRWDDGRTLVHKAIDWPGLGTLLEFRPDVNVLDKDGRAPLHEVYGETPLENVKLLVRAGADLNLADGASRTPLVEAVRSENLEVAEYLISRKPDLNKASLLIGGPLHIACKVGSLRLVEAMLSNKDNKADVHLTCERIIDLLVEHGADVAAARGSLGTVAGIPDALGRLALHLAALRGNMEAVEVLLDAGEDAAAADKVGRTALHWAVQGGDPAVVSLILTKVGPAAVNQRDKDGWTPLCWAARGCGCDFINRQVDEADQLEVLNKLIEMGGSKEEISELPEKKWTPFGIATYHGRLKSVLDLLAPDGESSEDVQGAVPEMLLNHRLAYQGTSCDYCHHNLDGYQYSCRDCKPFEFDLCYKCHNQRSVLHDPDHTFERLGAEFIVGSPSVSSRASSRQSSTEVVEESTSESNSDSEDSDSGHHSAGED
ncbi:hypothetical protein PG997_007116 [Apiospora hydei]|uniref:Nephrocystin 3-like N-terminal domain-containing protein n=1 Tax=Apiospora hydei TaxID=1337664 RepID=A0ABR1WQN6_9PEZI